MDSTVPEFIVTDTMREYSSIRYALYFVAVVYVVGVLLFLLQSGTLAALEAWVRKMRWRWPVPFAVFFLGFSLMVFALKLPLYYLAGFLIPRHFGLLKLSFVHWLEELIKAQSFNWLIACLLAGAALLVVARFPRRWWLIVWSASVPLAIAGIFLMPLVFDPMFNKYTSLAAGPLKTKISAMAARAGIPDAPIFVVDKSKQTKAYNAYVTGIGPTARIVLWDNILKMPEDELLSIVGHEIGHYALHHIILGCAYGLGGTLVLIYGLHRAAPYILCRLPKKWGVATLTSFCVVPVVYLGSALVGFVGDPVVNAISREMETQADRYALTMTKDGRAQARTFVSLATQNLSNPDPPPFIEFWTFSHPSLRRRYDRAIEGNSN